MIRPITKVLGCLMDTSDNIPGLPGIGKKGAEELLQQFNKDTDFTLLEKTKKYYFKHFQEVLKDKEILKQEKIFLNNYKAANLIKVLRADKKSEALKLFRPDLSSIKSDREVEIYYKEMYTLLHMLTTKKEGKKHGFKLTKPLKCDKIDWDEVIDYEENLDNLEEENLEIDDDILENL